ncbi:MAG: hypothetical protein ACLQVX_05900 [Limisphaerales bacterium]
MESDWATGHLQVIRTLMERSAVYRRALAPVMTSNGVLGTAAAAVGLAARIEAPRAFIGYWMAVALVGVAGSFLLARRQALKDAEPFWSPPTRRVAQALLPPLLFGFVLGLLLVVRGGSLGGGAPGPALCLFWLPLVWIALYGCALHAAGFFMPRGMKIFGWALVLASSVIGAAGAFGRFDWAEPPLFGNGVMGLVFGLAHLAYGVYLYFTEQSGNET